MRMRRQKREAAAMNTACNPVFARALIGLALACFAATVQGEEKPSCEAALPPGGVIGDRSGAIASMENLPQSCLKEMVIECSRNADTAVLDLDTAAVCSTGYEALLRKGFGGNFKALIAWWQSERASGRAR